MKKLPIKGTKDYLPRQAALRDYLKNRILETYVENGFEHIYTPAIEDATNLDKSDGGENLNLIFNILKRGEKLKNALNEYKEKEEEKSLYDLGLRYDLTLPLSRYYANNINELLSPTKCIQIDRVYRAEQPQQGRLREFIQCDIDIIGSSSNTCEMDLILTTKKALNNIGIDDFTIRINDRRILYNLLISFGFSTEDLDSVCISFDKLDKVFVDGVKKELLDKNFDVNVIEKFCSFLESEDKSLNAISKIIDDKEAILSLETIIKNVKSIEENLNIEFDISLVRGQGYYTGTIFEVVSNEFKGSIAGGGRYDKLIGKFLGNDVPAVGFSIGFERIFEILSKKEDYKIETKKKKFAIIYDEKDFVLAALEAKKIRENKNIASLFVRPKKLSKFIDRIKEYGFDDFIIIKPED